MLVHRLRLVLATLLAAGIIPDLAVVDNAPGFGEAATVAPVVFTLPINGGDVNGTPWD